MTNNNSNENIAEELAMEKHKLEAIFQDSPVALALWRGKEMIFENINPTFQEVFAGRTLVGLPILEAIPELEGQVFPTLLKQVFETGTPYYGHEELARIVHKSDGLPHDHYFDYNYLRINDMHGEPYGVFDLAVDVTDKVLARKALEVTATKLEHTVKTLEEEREIREQFVATLSHDLRSPLSAARMSAELLPRQRDNEETFDKTVKHILNSVDEMDEMIRNLLDANRITAGEKIPIKVAQGEIHEIIRNTLSALTLLYGDRFVFNEHKVPIEGYWDGSAIRRMIENLCGNAVKYGDTGKITISVDLSSSEVEINIAVQNWGKPIPKEDLDTLFEYFKRRKVAQIDGHVGWGIGLTIVRGLAEAHGGTAIVESTEEAGTIFKVILPVDSREKMSTS